MHPLWRAHHVAEHAIHAVTNFDFSLVRLNVNVARAIPNCLGEDQIDHLDDGRFAGHLLKVGKIGTIVDLRSRAALITGQAFENLLQEELFNLFFNKIGVGEDCPHRPVNQDT